MLGKRAAILTIATLSGLMLTLGIAASASAKLPKIGKHGKIKPNKSIGSERLDDPEGEFDLRWGGGDCTSTPAFDGTPAQDSCDWSKSLPASPFSGEYAHATFIGNGEGAEAAIISITAHQRASDGKFLPGKLSQWKTSKGIHLGSRMSKVGEKYPGATPNGGEAVNGFDLFAGSGSDARYTRFTSFGEPGNRVTTISLQWDTCHIFPDTC
jgi:hypothetical protein